MLFWAIALTIVFLDQCSKFIAFKFMKGTEAINAMSGVFEFRYSENTGIAFSLLQDHPEILTVVNSLILIFIVFTALKSSKLRLGYAFIIGGAIGNLIDRFMHGFVIDFINPTFINFAIFNVADVALNIGVVVLLIEMMLDKEAKA